MGFKLIAQFTLIIAGLVIIFAYIQPSLSEMKKKQDELLQYSEAITKASEFNGRLRELISIRDSFSPSDVRSLEKFVPTEIDQLKIMSEIAGILSSRDIEITKMVADEMVDPVTGVEVEGGIVPDAGVYSDLSYQDYEVTFTGSYADLREVLVSTEASDSLLEVVELNFDTAAAKEVDGRGNPIDQTVRGEHVYNIIFRTYGLPIASNNS